MKVKRGQVLGRLAPAAAPDHVSTLQLQIQRGLIERDLAAKTLKRLAGLAKEGLIPARRLADASATLGKAEAGLRAARGKAGQLRGRKASALPLMATADGTVVELHATDGHQVSAGEVLAHIAREQRVMVKAAAFSLDLPRINLIRRARLRLPARDTEVVLDEDNSQLLTRRVVLDPDTLTAPVAYLVENPDEVLRIGELAELRIATGQAKDSLTVPVDAVVEVNTRPYLYAMRTGESFDRLRVTLGPSDGKRVAVQSGLQATDRVVTTGAFDIYAAQLAGTVESHRH